ncbi:MAG: hypothetical protein ABFD69_00445 [Candidatus Sumerlaeia bacterium]
MVQLRQACFRLAAAVLFGVCMTAGAQSPIDGFDPNIMMPSSVAFVPGGKMLVTATDIEHGLVRINANGSFDPAFNAAGADFSGASKVMVQPDGQALISGSFSSIDGVQRNGMARLNPDGTLDATFKPGTAAGDRCQIYLIQPNGGILAGRNGNMIRLNADGSIDPAFHSLGTTGTTIAQLPDGKWLVSGNRTGIGGVTDRSIARLNPDGSLDAHLNAALDGALLNMAVQADGRIVLAGSFQKVNGIARLHVARIHADGSLDRSFDPDTPASVLYSRVVLQPDGCVLLAGGNILRLRPDGAEDPLYQNRSYSFSYLKTCDLQPDGKLVVSGGYTAGRTGGVLFIRLNTDGRRDMTFNIGPAVGNPVVTLLARADGRVMAGTQPDTLRFSADGTPITTGTSVRNVYAMLEQPDGKLVLGGSLSILSSGTYYRNIARLNADESLDKTFHPVLNTGATVQCVALQDDDKILIGGDFSTVNGSPRIGIARLNADGTLDDSFAPVTAGGTGVYKIIVQPDGKIVTVGSIAGQYKIARIYPDGTPDPGFTADTGSQVYVYDALLSTDGKIAIAGMFGLALLNSDGTRDSGFNPDLGDGASAYCLALQPDGKFLAGIFRSGAMQLMRFNADGSVDETWSVGIGMQHVGYGGLIRDVIVLPDGGVLAGGEFSFFDDFPCRNMVRLNSDGSVDRSSQFLAAGTNGAVSTIAPHPDGDVLIGGEFTRVNGAATNRIALLSRDDGTLNTEFTGTGADGSVDAVAMLTDRKMLVGGGFSNYQSYRPHLERIRETGLIDSYFKGSGANGGVNAIAVQRDGRFVVGGAFTQINGAVCNRIARLNADGSLENSLGSGANGEVKSIAVQGDGKIVLGGKFTAVRANPRGAIARLKADGRIDPAFAPFANDEVDVVVAQPDGKLLVGGAFTSINGEAINRIARLNADGSLDAAFDPGSGANGRVLSIALQADGRIQIAGEFTAVNGVERRRIARLDADGSPDASYAVGEGADGAVRGLMIQGDGKTLACGEFNAIMGVARRHFARLSNPDMAVQRLIVGEGGRSATWALGGSSPQPYQVLFENTYDNGTTVNVLGWGTAAPGVGYRLDNPNIALREPQYVIVTAWVSGGRNNGSVSLVRTCYYLTEGARGINAVAQWGRYE